MNPWLRLGVLTRGRFVWPADWKSAIQQVENLRYEASSSRAVHGKPTFAFCACIGAMNRNEGTDPSPRPSPLRKGRGRSVACARGSLVGSWEAHFRFCAFIGTMNRGDGSAGASPYRAHPTSDAYWRGGGSWAEQLVFRPI
ncbi:hypothetical protein SBV1_1260004 [Verrucomicrobia bacterium]|nr:hypothetical protein SBV1_1260004 [Verrucomicrobiota bacterium]